MGLPVSPWPITPFTRRSLREVLPDKIGRMLLKGGVVLTFDAASGDFEKADVLIEGKKIVAVQPNISATAMIIDASNMIVLPGFIDSHHHCYQGALRNIQTNGLLDDYSRDIVGEATPFYRPEDAYVGELISAVRALDAGITTVMDISQVSNSPEHSDACIKGLQDGGIRAVFAYARGFGPKAQYPQDIERLQKRYFPTADQLLTLAMGTQLTEEQWAVARKSGVRIFTHVVGRAACDTILNGAKLVSCARTTFTSMPPAPARNSCARPLKAGAACRSLRPSR